MSSLPASHLVAPAFGQSPLRRMFTIAACALASNPAETAARSLRHRLDAHRESERNGIAPVVIFVVLVALLAVLASAISIAVLIYCARRGLNFDWYVKTSWFEVKLACRR